MHMRIWLSGSHSRLRFAALRRARSQHALTALLVLAMSAFPVAARAQSAGPAWRFSVGAGVGLPFAGSERETAAAPALRFSVERQAWSRLTLGLEWLGTWFHGPYGSERRYNLGLAATVYPRGGFFIGAGLGLGMATRITEDGPTECCGDLDVGVFTLDSGSGLTATAGFEARLSRHVAIVPLATLAMQRVGGETVGFGWLGGRLTLGTR